MTCRFQLVERAVVCGRSLVWALQVSTSPSCSSVGVTTSLTTVTFPSRDVCNRHNMTNVGMMIMMKFWRLECLCHMWHTMNTLHNLNYSPKFKFFK